MIFVTVGTHEQQFNRLVECMDKLAGKSDKEIIIQTGFSTYEPKYCKWQKLFSYNEMDRNIREAEIVITHGGPSSFIAPLQIGKIPIVVPRKKEFGEHVNDHQVHFCRQVAERMGIICVVEDVGTLPEVIREYDKIVSGMKVASLGNNAKFCSEFEKIVDRMMGI